MAVLRLAQRRSLGRSAWCLRPYNCVRHQVSYYFIHRKYRNAQQLGESADRRLVELMDGVGPFFRQHPEKHFIHRMHCNNPLKGA